ncbi:MAG: family 43 glycosylhydrolase [Phycisphaerae bacterium]|nr:family 43 glycosylhydrolase [Phycisphaerae bacterium]
MPKFDYTKIKNPVWSLPKIHLRDPAVLVHDGKAYLYFTYYDPKAKTWHIGMSTTEDFLTFTEIKIVSPEGYASPGNVIRVGDEWILCYQQYRQFPHYLCIARSKDLTTWSPPEKIFNTGPENKWNVDKRTIDPFLVADKGKYYCYYVGSTRWGKPKGHNLIGVAGSSDLKQWTDLSTDKPVIGVDFEWEEPDGNENNCVIRHKNRWFMLYSAGLKNQKIASAVGDDLIHWENKRLCDVPVFKESSTGFGAPVIIENLAAPGLYYMLYQGRGPEGHMSFFLLESNDLLTWK